MRKRSSVLTLALFLATGCSGHEVVIDPDPGIHSTGRTIQTTPVPTGAKAATSNPRASTAARLGIPPGHLPEPGNCRVWVPGKAPGQQKTNAEGDCSWVATQVPAGGWLVWRPGTDRKEVIVREYGDHSRMLWTRVYDLVTGNLLHEDSRGE
jgi:hypothetical protein